MTDRIFLISFAAFLYSCLYSNILFCQVVPIQPVFQSGHQTEINEVLFQESGEHLISSSIDGTIVVWDLRLGLQRQSIQGHENGLSDMALISDNILVSSSNSGVCKVWSLPELSLLNEIKMAEGTVNALCKINDSTIAVAGSQLQIWQINTKNISQIEIDKKGDLNSLAYDPNRKTLATSGRRENVITFLSTENNFKVVNELIGNAEVLKFKNDNLLQINRGGEFRHYDLLNGNRKSYSLKEDVNSVTDVARKQHQFALSTTLGQVLIVNSKNHQLEQSLTGGDGAFTSLNFSSNDKWLAAGDMNGQVFVYNCENYELKYLFGPVSSSISDIKINGNKMILGYTDASIRELNLLTNEITTNSIRASDIEQSKGVSYSIVSVDSITENSILFTAARIKRHHNQLYRLASLQKLLCSWDTEKNQIIILEKKKDKKWDALVRKWDQSEQKYNLDELIPEFQESSNSETNFNFKRGENWFYATSDLDTTRYETRHKSPLRGLFSIPDKHIIVSYSKDPGIKLWNYDGEYLATLYLSGQAKFAYFTADNHYFTSKGLMNKIGFLFQDKLYSYEQFDPFFNRPDKIISKLDLADSATVELYKKAHEKRLSSLDILTDNFEFSPNIPTIEVTEIESPEDKPNQKLFRINGTDSIGVISSYSYSINGAEKAFQVAYPSNKLEVELKLDLSWGINELAFSCRNDKGINSLVHKQIINNEVRHDKPDLYVVAMGVSTYQDSTFSLRFADKDASEVANLFAKNKKQYQKVFSKTLLNEEVTKSSMNDVADFLGQAKTNDRIIVYFAGHGVLDKELNYYLASYDLNFSEPQHQGINFEEFESIIENQECRNKLILIDACHSGEIDKGDYEIEEEHDATNDADLDFRGGGINIIQKNGSHIGALELSKLLFPDLRGSKGTTIISSSAGSEFAYEDENLENGMFTYVLQKALTGYEADRNGDKRILLSELQYFLRKEVSALSQGRQNPVSRKENIKNDFVLW